MKASLRVFLLACAVGGLPAVSAPASTDADMLRQNNQAVLAMSAGDYGGALRLLRPLAQSGFALAQHNLGWMYFKGLGVPQDHSVAFPWFLKAAHQGLDRSQLNVALMYASGLGVAVDARSAAHWYRQAADQGDPTAQRELAVLYSRGLGVPKDGEQMEFWGRRAALQGDPEAQFLMTILYAHGKGGLPVDEVKGIAWLVLSAEQGYADAVKYLANVRRRLPREVITQGEGYSRRLAAQIRKE